MKVILFEPLNVRSLEGLTEITETLKETAIQANDAETIAHDALASIDARADEITQSMAGARRLQDDHSEMKFSLDAAAKALADIDASKAGRVRRQENGEGVENAAEVSERLENMRRAEEMIENMKKFVEEIKSSVKTTIGRARSTISK